MISFLSERFRRLRESRASEDGFTLIEVMIATGIILVGLVSLMYTTLVGLADIATARSRQSATSIVNQTIEQMRALSQPTLAAGMNGTFSMPTRCWNSKGIGGLQTRSRP